LEFIIAFIWILILAFHIVYIKRQFNIKYIIDPVFLFLSGQTIILIILGIVNYTGYLKSAEEFSFPSLCYILTLGLSFLIGSLILDKKRYIPEILNKKISKRRTQIIIKIAFFVNFVIGTLGTLILLRGFYSGNLLNLLPYFISNFDRFDRMFFNSSAAILWQANLAVLFWAGFFKDNWFKIILISIATINILLRAAFLYLVVAAFYYIIPNFILSKKKHFILILIFILILVPIFNYPNSTGNVKKMLISVTPYTFGNFTNYNIYFNEMYKSDKASYDLVDIFRHFGFGSIMFYMDKYIGTNFLKHVKPSPFYNQLQDYTRYGNLSSFYGKFIKVPYLFAIIFIFFLGLLNRIIYNNAYNNLFFLSIYSWFAASNFMSFTGLGYFASTRFIPAVLFIWPFLLIISLLNMDISHRRQTIASI